RHAPWATRLHWTAYWRACCGGAIRRACTRTAAVSTPPANARYGCCPARPGSHCRMWGKVSDTLRESDTGVAKVGRTAGRVFMPRYEGTWPPWIWWCLTPFADVGEGV